MGQFKDLTGKRFGRLVVMERAESQGRKTMWRCKCDCGNEVVVRADALTNGRTKSCGCLYTDTRHTPKPQLVEDLTGQRFGRLTVISRAENDKYSRTRWNCVCDCGSTLTVTGNNLKSAHTRSCGCLSSDIAKELAEELAEKNGSGEGHPNATHLKSQTRLYKIWSGMKTRCFNPHSKSYARYGGRGIEICDEWLRDFENFYAWAVSHGYRDDLTIDRIDNDGPYAPWNCRWATAKEQANNRG